MKNHLKLTVAAFVMLAALVYGALYLMSVENRPKDEVQEVGLIKAQIGGEIEYQGLHLEIPPGALSQDTRFSVSRTDDISQGSLTDEYVIFPEGLKFNRPVTLALPFNPRALTLKQPRIDLAYTLSTGQVIQLPFWIDWRNNMLITQVREL